MTLTKDTLAWLAVRSISLKNNNIYQMVTLTVIVHNKVPRQPLLISMSSEVMLYYAMEF
jgi:hypothetical protein